MGELLMGAEGCTVYTVVACTCFASQCHLIPTHEPTLGGFACGLRVARLMLLMLGERVSAWHSIDYTNPRNLQSCRFTCLFSSGFHLTLGKCCDIFVTVFALVTPHVFLGLHAEQSPTGSLIGKHR